MQKAGRALAVAAAVITASSLTGWHVSQRGDHAPAAASVAAAGSAPGVTRGVTPAAFTAADAARLQAALGNSDPVVAQQALVPAVRSSFGNRAAGLVHGLRIDVGSFTSPAAGVATVNATDATSRPYLLLLQQDHGTWLLYGTRRQ